MLFAKSSQGLQRLEEGKVLSSQDNSKSKKIMIPLNDCLKIWSPSPSLIEVKATTLNHFPFHQTSFLPIFLSLSLLSFQFLSPFFPIFPPLKNNTNQAEKLERKDYKPNSCCSHLQINTRSGEEYLLKVDGREEELTGWLLSLQQVAFGFMTESEENQLYEDFVRSDSLFRVQVIASPVKTLKDFHELYLRLTEKSIELLSPVSIVPVFTWNFRDIRRYGSSPETFTLEAGRRCTSGPGIFSFATPKGTQFFSLLSANLRQVMEREQSCPSQCPSTFLGIASMSMKPLKPPRKMKRDDCDDDISLTPPPSPSQQQQQQRANNILVMTTSSTSSDDNYSPDYENILSLVPSSSSSIPPSHYLQNDAEYAVVLKEKPKSNSEQLIE